MDEENTQQITIEDIQDLIIYNKFVRIESSKYTDEAYAYVKYLIDQERAILFDKDTKRIYTLGEYYGGDELKENLLYVSKYLSIDIDDEVLEELNIVNNSDILAFKGKGPLEVNLIQGKYNTVELEYNLNRAIDNSIYKVADDREYGLYLDENGKIALNEYIYPDLEIEDAPMLLSDPETKTLTLKVKGTVEFKDWEQFYIETTNCTYNSCDTENKTITVTFRRNVDGELTINYSDGKTSKTYKYVQKWYKECIYGLFDGQNYIEYGKLYFIDDKIDPFIIDQKKLYMAYVRIPEEIKPIFFDNSTNMIAAWEKVNSNIAVDNIYYNVYRTINSGLGKVEWKITNKKI